MKIVRVDDYKDGRFSQKVLYQHGCFLVDDAPYEVEIISDHEAIVKGDNKKIYSLLIEEFRFYTPHITIFYDEKEKVIKEYPKVDLIPIDINEIQPSQFYVDKEKINAISGFIEKQEDIIIQVCRKDGMYISVDGHTRLYYAYLKGWKTIRAIIQDSEEYVEHFVEEAQNRNIYRVSDMELLDHKQYQQRWNDFCDDYFSCKEREEQLDED